MTLPLCSLFSMLADKLNMTPEEAERWIVNLIRNARLDAKIDSKLVRLYMRWSPLGVTSFKSLCISLWQKQAFKNNPKILTFFFSSNVLFWICLLGSCGDGQQCSVTVSAGDWEDEEPVFPQPDVDNEHWEENGPQQQKWGNLRIKKFSSNKCKLYFKTEIEWMVWYKVWQIVWCVRSVFIFIYWSSWLSFFWC